MMSKHDWLVQVIYYMRTHELLLLLCLVLFRLLFLWLDDRCTFFLRFIFDASAVNAKTSSMWWGTRAEHSMYAYAPRLSASLATLQENKHAHWALICAVCLHQSIRGRLVIYLPFIERLLLSIRVFNNHCLEVSCIDLTANENKRHVRTELVELGNPLERKQEWHIWQNVGW